MSISNSHLFRRSFQVLQWCAAAIYFILFIYVVFFARRRRQITERHRNLRPVKGMLQRYHELSTGNASAIASFYENLFGNIIMFVPLPIIMFALLGFKNRFLTLAICIGVSAGIELIQYIFAIGIADSDDVILNSTGAVIGILLYSVYEKLFEKKAAMA